MRPDGGDAARFHDHDAPALFLRRTQVYPRAGENLVLARLVHPHAADGANPAFERLLQKTHALGKEVLAAHAAEVDRDARFPREAFDALRQAAYSIMRQAYMKASGDMAFVPRARQVMYCARDLLIPIVGVDGLWTNDQVFTQHFLPDYIRDSPEAHSPSALISRSR